MASLHCNVCNKVIETNEKIVRLYLARCPEEHAICSSCFQAKGLIDIGVYHRDGELVTNCLRVQGHAKAVAIASAMLKVLKAPWCRLGHPDYTIDLAYSVSGEMVPWVPETENLPTI
tara:strand:+ start:344 stop:694 length:351 start_codon:yes stop_codon:yes gene_type:complete